MWYPTRSTGPLPGTPSSPRTISPFGRVERNTGLDARLNNLKWKNLKSVMYGKRLIHHILVPFHSYFGIPIVSWYVPAVMVPIPSSCYQFDNCCLLFCPVINNKFIKSEISAKLAQVSAKLQLEAKLCTDLLHIQNLHRQLWVKFCWKWCSAKQYSLRLWETLFY